MYLGGVRTMAPSFFVGYFLLDAVNGNNVA